MKQIFLMIVVYGITLGNSYGSSFLKMGESLMPRLGMGRSIPFTASGLWNDCAQKRFISSSTSLPMPSIPLEINFTNDMHPGRVDDRLEILKHVPQSNGSFASTIQLKTWLDEKSLHAALCWGVAKAELAMQNRLLKIATEKRDDQLKAESIKFMEKMGRDLQICKNNCVTEITHPRLQRLAAEWLQSMEVVYKRSEALGTKAVFSYLRGSDVWKGIFFAQEEFLGLFNWVRDREPEECKNALKALIRLDEMYNEIVHMITRYDPLTPPTTFEILDGPVSVTAVLPATPVDHPSLSSK